MCYDCSLTDCTDPVACSPTDCTDLHRCLGCAVFSHRTRGIHRSSCRGCSSLCCTDLNISVDPCHLWEVISRMWVRGYGRMPYPPTRLLCVPCVLWEDTVCFVGAAETAAPPELASVGYYFKNVGAWVWQDAIPSYKTSVRSVHLWEVLRARHAFNSVRSSRSVQTAA